MREMSCYVCGVVGPSKFSRAAGNWDWFHGYLPETVHFCPAHRNSPEHEKLLEQSKVNPVERQAKGEQR